MSWWQSEFSAGSHRKAWQSRLEMEGANPEATLPPEPQAQGSALGERGPAGSLGHQLTRCAQHLSPYHLSPLFLLGVFTG